MIHTQEIFLKDPSIGLTILEPFPYDYMFIYKNTKYKIMKYVHRAYTFSASNNSNEKRYYSDTFSNILKQILNANT